MLGAYVCRQCRVRIARRVASPQLRQWQPRATFRSLRSQNPPETSQKQQEGKHGAVREGLRTAYTPGEEAQPARRRSRYSHLVRETPGDESQSAVAYPDGPVPLPDEPLSYRDEPVPYLDESIQDDVQAAVEDEAFNTEISYTQAIEKALDPKERNIKTAWALFEKTYTSRDCKALIEPSFTDMVLLKEGRIFLKLLNAVNIVFCKGYKGLPVTPTQVLFRYEQLGIARPEYWSRQTLAYLTHQAMESANAAMEHRQQILPDLLHELISVWRLFFQCKGNNSNPLQIISTEWQLPTIESMAEDTTTKNFGARLQQYHPKILANPTLGFCAVYLYTISDALKSVGSLHQEAAPLLQFIERLLAGSRVDYIYRHTELAAGWKAMSPDVQQQIMREMDAAPQRALTMLGASGETLDESHGDEAANLEAFYLKRIARAVESTSSATNLEYVWRQVNDSYTSQGQKTAIPPLIYNALLSGFMRLLKPSRSVEIWNHMIAHGIQPTSRTWVALLDGCVKTRDLDGLNDVWQRMLNSGIEPDDYLWTVRVNGLISQRKITRGLMALDEMGKKWLAAEKVATSTKSKAANTVTKPTVEVVNAALSALVQIRPENMDHSRKLEFVKKVLGWAGNFDIRPDARTYNSIVHLYLRAGDYTNAFRVLGKMEVDGVAGDIATHTMIVNALFDSETFNHLSASEQTSRILSHLDSVEASGVKLNDHIYSIAVDRLLKQYSNHDAAKAVVEHLTARKRVPSAAMYTSLASFYFQQEPPNLLAVDGLVHQILTSHRVPSDIILFDRLIEGYATHGEVGKMMSVLARLSKIGRPTGWQTLSKVVRALVESGDFERARNLVSDVVRVEGVAGGGILGGWRGEQQFFALVKEFGIEVEEEQQQQQGMGNGLETGGFSGSPEHLMNVQSTQRNEPQETVPPEQQQRQPASVEDEDVHGFLTAEQEPAWYRA